MGIGIEGMGTDKVTVYGNGLHGLQEPKRILDMGNSGTSMRLLSGILSAQPFFSIMTGDSSLCSRPMDRVVKPLKMMGAVIHGRGKRQISPSGNHWTATKVNPLQLPGCQRTGQILRFIGRFILQGNDLCHRTGIIP